VRRDEGEEKQSKVTQEATTITSNLIMNWDLFVFHFFQQDILTSNAQCVLWEKVGAVLQTFFCEPATDVSAAFLNIKSGETACDTAHSKIVPADKNPPRIPLVFVEFFENLLYFDSGVYPGGKIFVCESAL